MEKNENVLISSDYKEGRCPWLTYKVRDVVKICFCFFGQSDLLIWTIVLSGKRLKCNEKDMFLSVFITHQNSSN